MELKEYLEEGLKHIQEPITKYMLKFEKIEDRYRVFIEGLESNGNLLVDLTVSDYQEAQELYRVVRERLFSDWIKVPLSPKSL